MEETRFELRNVTLIKGGVPILDDVSLKIPADRVTAVMGISGSGKSTLLKMIAGLIPPDRGQVLFENRDIFGMNKKNNEEFRRKTGFVFQDAALWANKSIYENLFIPVKFHFPRMHNLEIRKKIMRRLEEMDMASNEKLRPSQLSTGEQILIAFIRGNINDPQNLFLDNPLMSLDHEASQTVKDSIQRKAKEKRTIILTSQDSMFLSMITDYIILIENGKILEQNSVTEIRKSMQPRTRKILEKFFQEAPVYDQDILDILNDENSESLF